LRIGSSLALSKESLKEFLTFNVLIKKITILIILEIIIKKINTFDISIIPL
jgi:hypothetical protein